MHLGDTPRCGPDHAQRTAQSSITTSMPFGVFAMLVTAGVFVAPAQAASGFAAAASTGFNKGSRVSHSGANQSFIDRPGLNGINARVWDAGGGGPNQALRAASVDGAAAAVSSGPWVAAMGSGATTPNLATLRHRIASANLLAINTILLVRTGVNV